jgi:hypothetical protein
MLDSTTSNSPSEYGSASASAVRQVSSRPSAAAAADVEQLGCQVGSDHLGASACGGQGRAPGPGGDVEHALPALHVKGLDEDAAERSDDLIDDGSVAPARPHRGVLGLERLVRRGVRDRRRGG